MTESGKTDLRRAMRALRRGISPVAQRRAAVNLANHLARLSIFGPGRRVSFYFANDGEIDPRVSLRRAAAAGTVCLVPVLPAPGCRRLRFAEYVSGSPLVTNRFGIPEPRVSPRALYDALELDAVLVPLVAFDLAGNRLGMGGGFYDATLALRASWTRLARPKVIGLAHECQRVERIDAEPWDIPLDRIATDETVHLCRRGGVPQSMDERRC